MVDAEVEEQVEFGQSWMVVALGLDWHWLSQKLGGVWVVILGDHCPSS
jgi:hypothetical protein